LQDKVQDTYKQHFCLVNLLFRNPPAARLTASAFNRLDHYASSPGNSAYCYAELAVSCSSMAKPSPVLIIGMPTSVPRANPTSWWDFVRRV